MVYEIFEGNMERLEKKLNLIQSKCRKYGCEFTYKQTGEEFRTITNENGERVTVRFVLIDAEGVAKVNGWEFVATIEHNSPVNVIRFSALSIRCLRNTTPLPLTASIAIASGTVKTHT